MRPVPFLKMHGLGNDFVVIDARTHTDLSGPDGIPVPAGRLIADRRLGIGCDQLISIEHDPEQRGDIFMRIRNPDGGEAEACGNATRCIANLIMTETGQGSVAIRTLGGDLSATRDAATGVVTVDMGPAYLGWNEIPVAADCDTLSLPLDIQGYDQPVGVNMGNPHAVFIVPDAEAVPLSEIGPVIESDPLFPERTNVEFVQILSRERIRMRVWERSAGITQACGSGACAALVATARRGLTERTAEVVLDGGPLTITWREDGHVLMAGPVATSFTGTLPPEVFAAYGIGEAAE